MKNRFAKDNFLYLINVGFSKFDGVFEELIFLLKKLNISIWDWIKVIYQNSTNKNFLKFNNLLSDYLHDTEQELWPNYNDLRNFCNKKENIDKFIKGELGSNLVFKYKSRSLTIDQTIKNYASTLFSVFLGFSSIFFDLQNLL